MNFWELYFIESAFKPDEIKQVLEMPRYGIRGACVRKCTSRARAAIHRIDTEHEDDDSEASDYGSDCYNEDEDYKQSITTITELFKPAELECESCRKTASVCGPDMSQRHDKGFLNSVTCFNGPHNNYAWMYSVKHQSCKDVFNSVKCLGCNYTVCADCVKADWRCGEGLSESCVNELCAYAGDARCRNMVCAKQTRKIYGSLCPECYGCYTEDTTVCLNDNGIMIGGVVELILGFVDFDEAAEQVLEQEYRRQPINCTNCGDTRYRRPHAMPDRLTCSTCRGRYSH